MYKDPNSSSGSGASTKGDEVELVSRFLAPLCARDEAARNIALAAARTTVEGWLGGVGSPNQWDDTTEIENTSEEYGKFKGHQDGRYDMSIERSPRKSVPKLSDHRHNDHSHHNYQQVYNPLEDAFRIEGFFPQSVTENPSAFIRENSLEPIEKCPSGSYDCIDGRLGNESWVCGTPKERWQRQSSGVVGLSDALMEKLGRSNSSDEGKAFNCDERARRFRESSIVETRFSSSNESERKFIGYGTTSREMYDEACNDETKQRFAKNFGKIKGARQKQLEDDDLDSDTRIYGKSPKFDESHGGNFGPYESQSKGASYSARGDNYNGRHDRDSERYDRRNLNVRSGRRFYEYSDEISFEDDHNSPRINRNRDGVVFNTLEGFENENINAISRYVNDEEEEEEEADENHDNEEDHQLENMNLENPYDENDDNVRLENDFGGTRNGGETISLTTSVKHGDQIGKSGEFNEEHYMRNIVERKFSAGQIKRPLSQDEDVSSKSGRTLEGPEVTPGDVGRMLNLGNALDGPRQAPPNKYLSLVSLHLPVILRLSVNCPFENVRIKCAEILLMVKDRGLPVPEPAFDGPSAFVPTFEIANKKERKKSCTKIESFLGGSTLEADYPG